MASTMSKSVRDKANFAYLKKRSDYRATRVEKPIEFNAADFVDAGKTILHGPRLIANQKLTVKIPRWTYTPPETFSDTVTLMVDKGDGNGFVDGPRHVFTRNAGEADFKETFPFTMDIPIELLARNATCQLQYRIDYFNNDDDSSAPVSFLSDQVKPYNGEPPAALTLVNNFLDDTNLPVGGKLEVTVPPAHPGGDPKYDWKLGDIIAIYLVDAANIPDDPTTTTPLYVGLVSDPGTSGAKVEIDADKIRALGDTEGVFAYVLRDTAFNDSVVSHWTKVSLTFGALPTPLEAPEVPQADPVLLVEHARDGVSVWIPRHAAFKPGDAAELTWGTTVVHKDFPIPDNGEAEIEIPVEPARLMLLEYGQSTIGEKDTLISYRVLRKGRPFGPASETISVNFEVAIPWLPWPPVEDWPKPWHPSLLKGVVKNHDDTRTNQLTRADKNEKAFFEFEWHTQAVNGHVVNVEWNGQRVAEARLVFDDRPAPDGPGHAPGAKVRVEIPWTYIKDGGNGLTVPVQFWLSAPGLDNELPSEITPVNVNAIAVELPPAGFPSVTGSFPNCASLEVNGDLRVAIPDLSGRLKDGDEIRAVFTPMTGESGPETPIAGAEFEDTFILGTDGDITGFEFLVTPYDTHIKPLYDQTGATNRRGRMKIQYFFNDGSEVIPSDSYTRITAFHAGADSCPIPRP